MHQSLSTKALVRATLLALVIALVVLITVILPAEYNIDPTGLGEKLGLTALAKSTPQIKNRSTLIGKISNDTLEISVPAGRGVEFKFAMEEHKKIEYEWLTNGEALYFDLHGEPKGDTTGYFESYAIATLNQMKGSFTTPFAGSHGWYWKNKSDKPVRIQLMVKGEYTIIGLKQ